MNIALKPDTRKILKRLVAEGRYASEQAALTAAVHQLDDLSWVDWPRVAKAAAEGFTQLDREEGVHFTRQSLKALGERIKREGREKLRQLKKAK